MLQHSYSSNRIHVGPLHPGPASAASSTSTFVFPPTTGATTTRHMETSRISHSPDLPVSPTSPPQAGSKSSFEYAYRDNAHTASSSSSSSSASIPHTSVSTPMPPPNTVWPPPLLPSTARNAAQFEADAPLNLGADEDEQVWTGESVGLGFGLLTKGKVGIDAVNWDCRICEKTANDPCVTRCGHLFCWTHLREHLTASPASSAACPTCKTPTRMDRDVVQVFGRPKVVPADAPWTSGVGSGASTCSFGPMSGGNPSLVDLTIMQSQPAELPCPTILDGESLYLVAQNQIYLPVLSTPHSQEASLTGYGNPSSLGLVNIHNPASPEAAVLPPPPSSPVLGRFELSSSPSDDHSPINANHPSSLAALPPHPEYEHKRRASTFSWVTASGTSRAGSMQLSQSSSSLWDDESSCGSRLRSNTIDLRDEDEDDLPSPEPVAPTPRRVSLTGRPMKGFWSTKAPVKWLPPKSPTPEQEPPAPPIPRIEIRAATYDEIPRRSSRLRTKGWHPGSSMFAFTPTEPSSQVGVTSSSDSDEYLSRFRPQRYDHSAGDEPPLSRRGRTPSRKVFRNMDVDFADGGSGAATAAAAREAALRAVDEEQNPLGRAIMLLALALFLMVLLK